MRRAAFAISLTVLGLALLAEWARAWLLLPDLSWGWAVPVLCGYFLWLRLVDLPPRARAPFPPARAAALAAALVTGTAAARLWLEPFPGWPLMEWAYSLGSLALMWLMIAQFEGRARANHCWFPLALGLVAIPWPALVTEGLIGHLRFGLADLVAEFLTLCQRPALATGTTIETARGAVGIDEACGGIHSLQTSVLVGLAIGELRRTGIRRRIAWLAAAITVALFCNTLRIGFLGWQCAAGGPAAAARWHDTAATAEMVAMLLVLGARALRPGSRPIVRTTAAETAPEPPPSVSLLGWAIAGSLLIVEAAIAVWFGLPPAHAARSPVWPARLPSQVSTFEPEAYTEPMAELLQADRHELGRWTSRSGARREAYLLEWHRGQRAQYVLRGHNPDICLGLAGSVALAQGQTEAQVDGRRLRFETRRFRRAGTEFCVYFLAWDLTDDVAFPWGSSGALENTAQAWSTRWQEIRAHRRSFAARVLTIAIYDEPDAADADGAFRAALQQITEL